MNVLRDVHVLLVAASQSLNSFIGNIPDWSNRCMVFVMSCVSEYGSGAIIAISWHCSTCKNKNSGASLGLKSALNSLSLFHMMVLLGLPNIFSNCVRSML